MYFLPKAHKENVPLRPILSAINGPTFKLSSFYVELLKPSVGKTNTWIYNSLDFKEKIADVILPPDFILVSLDVVNLFTNIPNDLVLKVIEENFDDIQEKAMTFLSYEDFVEGLNLILRNCFFSVDNVVHHQIFGSPMGSPVSPILANLVMEYVEERVVESLDFIPPFFFRYVDDIITAIPASKVNYVLERFNNFHERIKFTLEKEIEGRIPFLDLLVIRQDDGSLITDWYHKPTWSGRYMNFNSWLPMSYKRNTVTFLTDKILTLSDKTFHEKNLTLLVDKLRSNNYPMWFVRENMSRRISQVTRPRPTDPVTDETSRPLFLSVPYVKILFEKLRKLFSSYDIRLVGKASSPLKSSVFSRTKDPIPLSLQSSVVYEVECSCEKVYVGQTKQFLGKRLKNHTDAVRKKNGTHSALSKHAIEEDHQINVASAKVLRKEPRLGKRLILEMIQIRKRPNALNTQQDCVNLGTSYDNLF
jgi:predicted GIY-YIG superfamily endonuclease